MSTSILTPKASKFKLIGRIKRLTIPKPQKYSFADADWIKKDLLVLLNKRGRAEEKLTLAGDYKNMRSRPSFASLGDYVILSQVVNFFKKKKLEFRLSEVRRCLNYFEDYQSRAVAHNKLMTRSLVG